MGEKCMHKTLRGQAFWNSVSSDYSQGRTRHTKLILDSALLAVIGKVEGKKVLDVACGAGALLNSLARRGAVCTGVDYAEEMIRVARRKARKSDFKIDYRIMDARRLVDLPADFDLAIISLLFPHLSKKKEILSTLSGVARVLKPGGRLVVAEPHPSFDYYIRRRLETRNFNYFSSGLKYAFEMRIGRKSLSSIAYHWTLQDYSDALSKAGFLIERILEPNLLGKIRAKAHEQLNYPPYIILDCSR